MNKERALGFIYIEEHEASNKDTKNVLLHECNELHDTAEAALKDGQREVDESGIVKGDRNA